MKRNNAKEAELTTPSSETNPGRPTYRLDVFWSGDECRFFAVMIKGTIRAVAFAFCLQKPKINCL
jgi:hypothetical protein